MDGSAYRRKLDEKAIRRYVSRHRWDDYETDLLNCPRRGDGLCCFVTLSFIASMYARSDLVSDVITQKQLEQRFSMFRRSFRDSRPIASGGLSQSKRRVTSYARFRPHHPFRTRRIKP